jgi:hypothetical protein
MGRIGSPLADRLLRHDAGQAAREACLARRATSRRADEIIEQTVEHGEAGGLDLNAACGRVDCIDERVLIARAPAGRNEVDQRLIESSPLSISPSFARKSPRFAAPLADRQRARNSMRPSAAPARREPNATRRRSPQERVAHSS